MLDLASWLASGARVPVALGTGDGPDAHPCAIFCRVAGAGPWLTLLHGFPTSSWDWAPLADDLRPHHRLLCFDFLGFGDSDKPRQHRYSIFEQADITAEIWRKHGVARTSVVAHDYGVTVAAELLARQAEGRLSTRIDTLVLLNAGIYVDLYRPLVIQTMLRQPLLGPALSHLITERTFARSFRAIFSPDHPITPAALHQHWLAIQRRHGARNYHALIRYIDERMRHRARWEGALERSDMPPHFIWGMLDPVSGAPIAARIRERFPPASLLELADVGHYPQLEVPAVVASAILRATRSAP
jgi:pimeloyl-ACP methyl ester carboxylesterase